MPRGSYSDFFRQFLSECSPRFTQSTKKRSNSLGEELLVANRPDTAGHGTAGQGRAGHAGLSSPGSKIRPRAERHIAASRWTVASADKTRQALRASHRLSPAALVPSRGAGPGQDLGRAWAGQIAQCWHSSSVPSVIRSAQHGVARPLRSRSAPAPRQ